MSSWDYISKRRRTTLQEFVKGAQSLEEALLLFKQRGIKPPTDGRLEALYALPDSHPSSGGSPQLPKESLPVSEGFPTVDAAAGEPTGESAQEELEEPPIPGYPQGKKPKKQAEETS